MNHNVRMAHQSPDLNLTEKLWWELNRAAHK